MSNPAIPRFPRSTDIQRAIVAAAKAGVEIGSVEIAPTGAMRIYAASSVPSAASEFDEWDRRGVL